MAEMASVIDKLRRILAKTPPPPSPNPIQVIGTPSQPSQLGSVSGEGKSTQERPFVGFTDGKVRISSYVDNIVVNVRSLFSAVLSGDTELIKLCLLYTSPSPRDGLLSRMPSSA